jgi:hypothetical protein
MPPARFERTAPGLGILCSIHLSYGGTRVKSAFRFSSSTLPPYPFSHLSGVQSQQKVNTTPSSTKRAQRRTQDGIGTQLAGGTWDINIAKSISVYYWLTGQSAFDKHMKTRFRSEADNWSSDGSKITDSAKLEAIRRTLENEGPIIVEHWFYQGASAPERLIFEAFDEFETWLNEQTYAGDAIDIWSWATACQPDTRLAEGKCPDDDGLVPKGGAY